MKYKWLYLLLLLTINKVVFSQKSTFSYFAPDHTSIQYSGRIDFTHPDQPQFWQPGVNIQFGYIGDSCGVIIEDEMKWGNNHNYIQVVVDEISIRLQLSSKRDTIWIKGSHAKKIHQAAIYKNTEANIGSLTFHGLLCKKIQPVKNYWIKKIECIGNSITCGTGSDESVIPCGKGNWYDQHNAYESYGLVLARKLNAQVHLSSFSGIGLMHSCCNIATNMLAIYDKVDMGVNTIKWDFTKYQPDIVTLCLGQNDGVQDSAVFVANYLSFIQTLRKVYPAATILCLSSPMADSALKSFMIKTIHAVVDYCKQQGDKRIQSYIFSKQYNAGCDGHPSLKQHRQIADELEIYIMSAALF